MTKKKPANVTAEAWAQRQRVWRHNGFMGQAAMMQAILISMRDADSITPGTKYFVEKMLSNLPDLKQGLKTRIDP